MKKVPFIKIELPLLYRDDLSLADKVVFARLELYARKSGMAYMAVETLAKECRLGVRTTQESLRTLLEAGMITREERWRETAVYRISGVAKYATPEPQSGVAKFAEAKSAPN